MPTAYMPGMEQVRAIIVNTIRPAAAALAVSQGALMAHAATDGLSHDAWGDILESYVTPGPEGINRVDYDALKNDEEARAGLDKYIAQYGDLDFDTLSRDAQFAAWANLYNAVTVRYIVEAYPTGTIKPWYSSGPWKKVKVSADGREISLHGIEHDILREQWSDDPRLHYAVNCASYGCPNLKQTPWQAETLEADLEAAAHAYVNHPRGVTVLDNGLRISSIYDWYRDDFGGSEDAVIAHLLQYAEPALAEDIRANPDIRDHEYDWSLNDTE